MARMAANYARVAELALRIDGYALEGLQRAVSSGFERHSTLIRLSGGGHEGVGEDVSYDAEDHVAVQEAGATLDLAGSWTLESFSKRLDELDLFPRPASRPASLQYRR